jgi:hypothetical protein
LGGEATLNRHVAFPVRHSWAQNIQANIAAVKLHRKP